MKKSKYDIDYRIKEYTDVEYNQLCAEDERIGKNTKERSILMQDLKEVMNDLRDDPEPDSYVNKLLDNLENDWEEK